MCRIDGIDKDISIVAYMADSLLDLKIRKSFGGFSLQCEARFGDGITAIFGPSGSGKSTLLNSIAGLVRPDDGHIAFDGDVLYSSGEGVYEPPEKRRFGYVFQDSALFPHMSVSDNIHYGYKLTARANRRIEPSQLVELLQLERLMDRGVGNLSGGERQRVALARALATSPRLLLLDEPLASLDSGLRGVILEYLKRIRRELGTPMVYVSHSISEVMALADNALALRDGQAVAYGRATETLVMPEVSTFAQFDTLENLLGAKVAQRHDDDIAELEIGDARVIAAGVRRDEGDTLTVSIRAGDIIVSRQIPPQTSARNAIRATVSQIHMVDSRVLLYADIGVSDVVSVVVEITPNSLRALELREGTEIYLIIKANSVLPLEGGA
ncbi:MAG: molybdenum ABC transporter ATP-binding protein [Chloroflexi bacterium]|nr:molybdenum ABC transporter ATP-binding protein [Chloroflexota bacterium]